MKLPIAVVLLVMTGACNAPSHPQQATIPTASAPASATATGQSIRFKTYCNQRFGYCVDYPASYLEEQPESQSGDGTDFLNNRDEAILTVWGRHNTDATGDVVSIDDDGFIAIRGRVKRFAKIGGETVSLAVVENIAAAVWPDKHHAVVSVKDRAKGEQIVLATDAAGARRLDLVAWAQNHGASELAVPRRIVVLDSLPVLGTGKTDYVTLQKLVESQAESP